MALPPKPVAKIITQKTISPLNRADLSKPKNFPKPTPPAKIEDLPPEDKEDALFTQEMEDDFLEGLDEEIPAEEIKPTPKKEEKPVVKQEKKATKESVVKQEKKVVPEKDMEEALDLAEDELSFLSSGSKKIEKELPVKETQIKKEQVFTTPETPEEKIPASEKYLQPEVNIPFVSTEAPIKEIQGKNITLNFQKKYESCYIPVEGQNPCNKEANIFLREVAPETSTFFEVVNAHKEVKSSIASPFKFFSKPDFVHIFQKAFLGNIFDLSYSTPYYYTKAGTHHLYLSSQVIEKAKMLHVVLLDVLPNKVRMENTFFADLLDFSIHRILLVSVNALYL